MNKNLERFCKWLETKSNFLLFDIEANFYEWKDIKEWETIQIWYIKFNSDYNIINKWSIFIKPSKYPILSEFIKDFTWITQDQVNKWVSFSEWLKEFYFIFDSSKDYIMSYWYYDMKQIYWDCKINNIPYPFNEWDEWKYSKHINIKNALAKKLNIREKWMKWLMDKLWLKLEWKHHNWEDDCVNILKLIKNIFILKSLEKQLQNELKMNY